MWIIVLLGGLFGPSVMGAESCSYQPEIFSDPVKINSPGYPSNYPINTNCLWEASTLIACKLKLICTDVNIPSTPVVGCTGDYIQVSPSGSTDFKDATKRCGTKSFTVTSNSDKMTIKLSSNNLVMRGKFLCTIQAISDTRICEVDNSTSVKNILDLRGQEKMHFLNSFDYFMTDCYGTLWLLEKYGPIQDSGKALNDLESMGKEVIYVSDNSVHSDEEYEKKITEIGATYRPDNLVYPLKTIIHFLRDTRFIGYIYFIGSTNALNLLINEGFRVFTGTDVEVDENFDTLTKLQDDLFIEYVIVDFDFKFSYGKFLKAVDYLRRPVCNLIVAATDYSATIKPGYNLPGQGYFVDAIVAAMPPGKEYLTLGKPAVELGDYLKEIYKINDPRSVLIVGDMLYPDIKMAHNNGYQSLLVLTGGTTKQDMIRNKDNSTTPDYYAESIGDIAKVIQSVRGQ